MAKKHAASTLAPRTEGVMFARGMKPGDAFKSVKDVAAEAFPGDQAARADFIAGALDAWPRLELSADGTIEYVKHRPA